MIRQPFVADASPLIALTQINRLGLLHDLVDSVLIPPAVALEVVPTLPHRPPWIVRRALSLPIPPQILRAGLDPGETDALSLAVELQAADIALDDLRARRLALAMGVPVIGTLGLLLRAKRRGLLHSVLPEITALIAVGFYAAPTVIRSILVAAGENQANGLLEP
jgi:predicted nucleic acid-binding protein